MNLFYFILFLLLFTVLFSLPFCEIKMNIHVILLAAVSP